MTSEPTAGQQLAKTDDLLPALVTITVLSHHGALRSNNEDCALVVGLMLAESRRAVPVCVTAYLDEPVVVAVADGLGGHGGGEVAAATALRRVAEDAGELNSIEAIGRTIERASDDISQQAAVSVGAADMATTLVGLAVLPSKVYCFNIGDSPAYRLDGGYLQQIATLDSPSTAVEAIGGQAVSSHLVTQVLGPGGDRLVPHVRELTACVGDTYLLCSDGLTDAVSLTDVERLLQENASDHQRAAKALWAAAMNAGGRDNITLVIVRLT